MKKEPAKQAIPLPFYKLHGAGNDIVIFRSHHLPLPDGEKAKFLSRMAHRRLGVGCDQFVEVLSKKPLSVRIWNGDGSTAEMCANGARVLLFLAAREGWIDSTLKTVDIEISGRSYRGLLTDEGYEICLGTPRVASVEMLPLDGGSIPFRAVDVGNPHAVILLGVGEGEWRAPPNFSFREVGSAIECHQRFPHHTNVEFVRAWKKEGKVVRAKVDVWERGAGATLSCGSGAVATAAVLRELQGGDLFMIEMNKFELKIRFEGDQGFLSGPCALVAIGQYFY